MIPKVVFPRFTTLSWGRGGDEVCSVNVHQLSNLGWIGLKGCVEDCRPGEIFGISNIRRIYEQQQKKLVRFAYTS